MASSQPAFRLLSPAEIKSRTSSVASAAAAESLEDYCLQRDRFYFGSKKTIAFLREYDPEGHALFQRAITHSGADSLRRRAEYIIRE